MVTPEEYESLPPSIQKKYFSSVERLRIAQESAQQKRKKQLPEKEHRLPPKPSMDSMRPRTAHSFKPSALSQPRKSFARPVRTEADVDEEQALRFLALPDKVKRSHFTTEELILLTESSERALGSPSLANDDAFSRHSTLDRNGSVASSHCKSSVSEGYMEDMEKDWYEMETESVDSYEHPNGTATDFEMLKMYARRRQGSVCSTYSALPPIPANKEYGSSPDSRRKSFSRKRAISLAPIPLPPPTLTPAVPPLPSPNTITNFSKPVQSPATTPTDTPPATRYYKDSQARQKLREFLASPEKFDEALEFGFPSERGIDERSTSVASAPETSLESDMDNLSITDSKDDEEEASSRSPKTPSLVNEGFHSNTTPHSSLDSGVALPFTPGKASFRSLSPDIAGREMTLRMTLTRPDLRASEQELYAFQRKEVSGVDAADSDPLALATLPVCDDHTGAHGAFAVTRSSKGGFKKVWKNLRGR
ncbi:hypothetical protein PRZ48_001610 [Zasmidium cellare]|uniref:Uncharacterized protein n=1 Tax=Zasmidium cellare TaxID=395010 RepID=A0ABR0F2F7_ZASCE|nr:hypothetical protein PRZ48_001610 [Zasmidium cellare]